MARSASSLVAPVKRFTVNGRLATGNGQWTVVWGLQLTGEEIRNTLTSGAYLGFVCGTCNDEAARCPELRSFVPAAMVAAAYDFEDEAPALLVDEAAPIALPAAPLLEQGPAGVHGHDRHACPICQNVMWSPGFSMDDTVACGACGNREKRQQGKDYAPCAGRTCTSRV